MIQERFLKWNSNNSTSHCDFEPGTDMPGPETFLHLFDDVFNMTTQACNRKDYTLKYEGVELIKEDRDYEFIEAIPEIEDDEDFERHGIELSWRIISDEGHFYIEVENKSVGIKWGGGKITDLQGNEARISRLSDGEYKVNEILNSEESDRLVLINRLEKLKFFSKDRKLKDQLRSEIWRLKGAV